ncbi:rhodanese-like domain-containing protein [Oleidesulfovibrio sp.]|uniref:rhodanese-like domain-containing protein n=1 Tax=Oleidesulfovibrio sp. TaxID=2909707 RepID=UPI003A89B8AE
MMRKQLLALMMLAFGLMLLSGCAAKQPHEPWMVDDIVDVQFVAQYVKVPHPENVMIIDSRPYEAMYVKGYIPTAVSIPDTQFDKHIDMLPANKDALLIFYCGGWHCKLSHKSAQKAMALGYTNVKVFAAGYPAWLENGHAPGLGLEALHAMMAAGDSYMLIDARPAKKYLEGSIPSAISIPDSQFDAKKGLLPADKNTPLIYFCGGLKCPLSHKSAAKAQALGYTSVWIAEKGEPGWKAMYGGGQAVTVQSGGAEGAIDIVQFESIMASNPASIMVVDVRDPDEYSAGHMTGAVNIPVDKLESQIAGLPSDKPVVFVCASGARSGEAFYMIRDLRPELKDVFYLEAETTYHKDGSFEIKKP